MIKVYVGNNLNRTPVMVDEGSTLRSTLEQNNIDYSIGMTSLDGSTLAPGDLDKTFADFGITQQCFLICTVKADNAASIKIVGRACVIESGVSLDDVKKIQKYRPTALTLYETENGKKEPVFAVGISKANSNGSINPNGASFGTTPTDAGKAAITLLVPEDCDDLKKWARETIGAAILQLKKVEEKLPEVLSEVAAEMDDIDAAITVM